MVYPALTYLEEIGHATVETEGTRKLYRITEAGGRHLEEHRAAAEALFAQFERVGERMESLRRAMRSDDAGVEEAIDEQERHGSKPLMRARRELNAALAEKWSSSPEEQERIAEILRRAAEEIGGKRTRG
jgi:DNA-binding PadR family transcriptional regulator